LQAKSDLGHSQQLAPVGLKDALSARVLLLGPMPALSVTTMDHARVNERIECCSRIAEVFSENLTVVLAEGRRLQRKFGIIRKSQRKPGNLEFPKKTVLDRSDRPPLAQVRMAHRLLNRQHQRKRHAMLLERPFHLLIVRGGVNPILNDLNHLTDTLRSRGDRVVARIIR
jgi:hypothetical protein